MFQRGLGGAECANFHHQRSSGCENGYHVSDLPQSYATSEWSCERRPCQIFLNPSRGTRWRANYL